MLFFVLRAFKRLLLEKRRVQRLAVPAFTANCQAGTVRRHVRPITFIFTSLINYEPPAGPLKGRYYYYYYSTASRIPPGQGSCRKGIERTESQVGQRQPRRAERRAEREERRGKRGEGREKAVRSEKREVRSEN